VPVKFSSIEENIGLIQVDRQEVRNALNWQAMQDFAACIESAHQDGKLKALIITGSGATFIAGGDLKELAGFSSQEDGERLSSGITNALKRLEALPIPTIAAINGPARGGGAEIALACDLRVMAENADLGFVHVNLGLTPGWGGGQRLLHLAGYSRALYWLATGSVLNAAEALSSGLANRVTSADQALDGALELARHLAGKPPGAVRAIKRLLRAGLQMSPAAGEEIEQREFIDRWTADEHLRAVERYLDRK
jgi:enoyl-CoA hydratase/carnithine racemase